MNIGRLPVLWRKRIYLLRSTGLSPAGSTVDDLWTTVLEAKGTRAETVQYPELVDELRARIAGRRAIHSLGPIQEALQSAARRDAEMEGGDAPAFEAVTHPLVQVHPVTKRRSLFLSPHTMARVEGLDETEGRALLDSPDLILCDIRDAEALGKAFDIAVVKSKRYKDVKRDNWL